MGSNVNNNIITLAMLTPVFEFSYQNFCKVKKMKSFSIFLLCIHMKTFELNSCNDNHKYIKNL